MTIEDEIAELEREWLEVERELTEKRAEYAVRVDKLKSQKLGQDLGIQSTDKLICIPELYQWDVYNHITQYSKTGDIAEIVRLNTDGCFIAVNGIQFTVPLYIVRAMHAEYIYQNERGGR